MFETKGPKNGSRPTRTTLNCVATNTLDAENFVMFGKKKQYSPFDSRFYDAFASFLIWNSITQGGSNHLTLYLSNGYNRDTRILLEDGTKHTVSGFVLDTYSRASRESIKLGLEPAVRYFEDHKRIPISSFASPLFKVVKHDKTGDELRILTNYKSEEYNCNMSLKGSHWAIQEFLSSSLRR